MSRTATDDSVRLALRGLKCAGCASAVEQSLGRLAGVSAADVSFGNESADVRFDPARVAVDDLIAAVRGAGFEAAPAGTVDDDVREAEARRELAGLKLRVGLSVPISLLLMAAMFWWPLPGWVQLVLTLPVWAWGGWPYHLGALRAARRLHGDMNVLISLGSSTAFVASCWMMAAGHGAHLYFDTAAMIIAFILIGRLLEALARRKTTGALRALLALRPTAARVLRAGELVETPIDRVWVGDIIEVRPGETIPVDGVIIDGAGSLDESSVTGESVPVERTKGEAVTAATTNLTGRLRVRAVAVGGDTLLGRMIERVREAQGTKAPIQRLADRVAGRFVPVVIALAGVSLALWWAHGVEVALTHAVAVLIIACPCALGLATPTAIMVGSGRGAQLGLLVRGGEALERAAKLDLIVFDKTGTLTAGTPRVTAVEPLAGDALSLLRWAAAAEAPSEHPYARALVHEARRQRLALPAADEFAAVTGAGIRATVAGREVTVGSPEQAAAAGADLAPLQPAIEALVARAETPLVVTLDGAPAGVIGCADQPREAAASALARLRAMGLEVAMLSGDDPRVAEAIARRVGVETVAGRLKPEDKQARIAAWRAEGRVVAMVGDGINDAPALAAADVGIALGSGTDVALEAGDIALLGDDLTAVPRAIALSRAVLRTIRGNLLWAFGYNVVMIPLAMGLFQLSGHGVGIDPIWAAAAMALSSVSVVSNSLRLRGWRG